jgi:hypothetical protein
MKVSGKFSIVKNLIELFRIYNHMKGQESRYGMEVKIADLIKVSKI